MVPGLVGVLVGEGVKVRVGVLVDVRVGRQLVTTLTVPVMFGGMAQW